MKRKFWRKKLMAMTVLMSLLLSATGCSEDPDAQTSSTKSSGSGDSWVIYWKVTQQPLPQTCRKCFRSLYLKM